MFGSPFSAGGSQLGKPNYIPMLVNNYLLDLFIACCPNGTSETTQKLHVFPLGRRRDTPWMEQFVSYPSAGSMKETMNPVDC